jgi:hypothetical protein
VRRFTFRSYLRTSAPSYGGFREICLVASALVLIEILPIVSSTADAKLSLRPSILALIDKFSTTVSPPLSRKQLVSVLVPAIGCPQDGQVGPLDAPLLPKHMRALVPKGMATSLAYYSHHESSGSGALAPRGWDCFGTYGSGGSTLYVVPRRLGDPILDRFEKLKTGPMVMRTVYIGGTSGRFGAARISARIFPGARAFVEQVRNEGLDDPKDYVFAAWPTDQLNRLSEFAVSYVTPAGTEGLGTAFDLAPGLEPIAGLVFLTDVQGQADGPFLDALAVRLGRADRHLYAAIAVASIGSMETAPWNSFRAQPAEKIR